MTTAVSRPTAGPLTVAEYEALVAQGAFDDAARVELVNGRICRMHANHPRHAATVTHVMDTLQRALRDASSLMVRVQLPIATAESVPEPDLAVVPRADYFDAHPRTAVLVVEVADTSRAFDLGEKASVYARAELPEYWVIDLPRDRVLAHREPREGVYQRVTAHARGDALELTVVPLAPPVPVADLLPPEA